MFTYCRKRREVDPDFQLNYNTSIEKTPAGKQTMLCNGVNVAYVHNRGLPRHLLDLEMNIRGQNKDLQPYCGGREGEEEPLQWSTFDRAMPRAPFGPLPCPPVAVMQTRNLADSGCAHGAGTCGVECPHTIRCECKEKWSQMNKIAQPMPPATMNLQETPKFF